MLLERAHKIEAHDYYSQGDIHLLNWVLVGDCECFEKPKSDGASSSAAMWKCLKNPEFMNRMAHSPVHVYCCKMLDQLLYDEEMCVRPYIAGLVTPTHIRHSVMLAVTTELELLSRSRRTGQFAKLMSDGGSDDKSCVHNQFACRNGLFDQFGIGFNNPAVLDISPPILTVTAPHRVEKEEGEPYTIVRDRMGAVLSTGRRAD